MEVSTWPWPGGAVAANICPTMDFDDVANMIDSVSISTGSPTQFVNVCVGEDGATYYASVVKKNFNKSFSVVVDGSATVTPHCILSSSVNFSKVA